jgi:hypothetical protein
LTNYAMRKVEQAGHCGTALKMVNYAMGFFVPVGHALKGAFYTRAGNYRDANLAGTETAKALATAKHVLDRSNVENGRQAAHLVVQRMGIVASGLAKAKLAKPLRDVQQSTRLKCVISDAGPLCKMADHW